MEKEYETYQYLTTNNVENDLNAGERFIIVQDDCTIMSVDKPIQYVTQIQDGKQVLEGVACPVYDVSSQPFYIDLNGSSELVPITVQPASIQQAASSNAYANNYLLPNSAVELIQPESGINILKQTNESVTVDTNKQVDSYAEITLSDEQYETLKQKGWILLEMKDKAFLLDSTGLHEITDDPKLIKKLKHDQSQIVCNNSELSGCPMKVVMIPTEFENPNESIMANQAESMDIAVAKEIVTQDINTLQETIGYNEQVIIQDTTVQEEIPIQPQQNGISNNNDTKKKSNRIHLKSQYLLKDIPREVVLGKTVNGKNLIARVVKGKGFFKNTKKSNREKSSDAGKDRIISEKHLAKLVQQILHGTAEKCRAEDITAAEAVVAQLLRLPDFTPTLHQQNLIITKTTREENEDGLIENQTEPAVVTGRLMMNGDEGGFVHIPDMLNQHMQNSEQEKYKKNAENISEKGEPENLDEDMFLHINITETKSVDNISRVSVMVNKRYLSLVQVYSMKTKHSSAVYACSACAKVFKTHEDLEEHQEYQCSEISVLPADSELPYSIVKTRNNTRLYMCNKCKDKFVKRNDCQRHLLTHYGDNDHGSDIGKYIESFSDDKKQTEVVYKCKMCPNTYFHSSSLTKHIVAKHINILKL